MFRGAIFHPPSLYTVYPNCAAPLLRLRPCSITTIKMEPTIGIEPMTSSLPRKRSTTELRGPSRRRPIRSKAAAPPQNKMERETGLEPATLSLEG